MSIIGATEKHHAEGRSKTYNVMPDYLRNSKIERQANRQFTHLLRACNGCVYTPALEKAIDQIMEMHALLVLPNLKNI